MKSIIMMLASFVLIGCSYYGLTEIEGKNLRYALIKGDDIKIRRVTNMTFLKGCEQLNEDVSTRLNAITNQTEE